MNELTIEINFRMDAGNFSSLESSPRPRRQAIAGRVRPTSTVRIYFRRAWWG